MKSMRAVLWAAMGLSLVLVGCGKKVTVTYFNATSDPVEVVLERHGVEMVPIAVPAEGQVVETREFDRDFLPESFVVRAGDRKANWTVDEDSEDEVWFIIEPSRITGPLNEGDYYEGGWEHKLERMPERHMVVE
jgi:hypothetical protein